jgi:hypothetical protein
LLLHTTLRAGQTCLAPLLRTAFRRHGCTERPAPPFPNKFVIASTLCVGIVVSAPFLRWPGTDRPSQHRAKLHNASVDEASKLEKTNNNLFGALCKISVSFLCVSAAALRLPDTDRPETRHQTACLSPFFLRNFALLFSQCFTSSYVIKSAFRVRLFPQPFFTGLARLGSLGKTGRSVNTATNGVVQKMLKISASCSCISAAANTALLRLQC